jgi:exodeoxyribonuclease VII large subunit
MPQATPLAALRDRWGRAADARIERATARLDALEQNLAHLNPQNVLERGYAIVTAAGGMIVHDARQIDTGDAVVLAFARGAAAARITRRDPD